MTRLFRQGKQRNLPFSALPGASLLVWESLTKRSMSICTVPLTLKVISERWGLFRVTLCKICDQTCAVAPSLYTQLERDESSKYLKTTPSTCL